MTRSAEVVAAAGVIGIVELAGAAADETLTIVLVVIILSLPPVPLAPAFKVMVWSQTEAPAALDDGSGSTSPDGREVSDDPLIYETDLLRNQ